MVVTVAMGSNGVVSGGQMARTTVARVVVRGLGIVAEEVVVAGDGGSNGDAGGSSSCGLNSLHIYSTCTTSCFLSDHLELRQIITPLEA